LLYALWSTLALWDLGHRDELTPRVMWLWALAIFALPFLGALAYLFLGGSRIAPRVRMLALGGSAAYLLILVLGASIGGIS
jgi:hypothetical protein